MGKHIVLVCTLSTRFQGSEHMPPCQVLSRTDSATFKATGT